MLGMAVWLQIDAGRFAYICYYMRIYAIIFAYMQLYVHILHINICPKWVSQTLFLILKILIIITLGLKVRFLLL